MLFFLIFLPSVISVSLPGWIGLHVKNDNSIIELGKKSDVKLKRTGVGKLTIESDVLTTGTLTASSLNFGRVTRYALDIDGHIYHPKCNEAKPAIIKLGKFGGSNIHMGAYLDIKVYGSHRGGFHCGGADNSHDVIGWTECDRQSYRHYVVYGGDKTNSFTQASSGNPKLVNMWDGKQRGDYINIATNAGVTLVLEQICGAYLDYTIVLEFHHRSATASGFELDSAIANKAAVSWKSIESAKPVSAYPIRSSRRRLNEADAERVMQNEKTENLNQRVGDLEQEVRELKNLVAKLLEQKPIMQSPTTDFS